MAWKVGLLESHQHHRVLNCLEQMVEPQWVSLCQSACISETLQPPPLAPPWLCLLLPGQELQPPDRAETSPRDAAPLHPTPSSPWPGAGPHASPHPTTALMRMRITCSVAFLGVTNGLIRGRPFEDEKPDVTQGLKAGTCPSLGLSQQSDLLPACLALPRSPLNTAPKPPTTSHVPEGKPKCSQPPQGPNVLASPLPSTPLLHTLALTAPIHQSTPHLAGNLAIPQNPPVHSSRP